MSLASRLIKAIFATEAGVLTAASSPAADDNSKKIATTEWAAFGFAILKAGNGYIKFPTWLGGLVLQWGNWTAPATTALPQAVTFPIPFPTNVLSVACMPGSVSGNANQQNSAWTDTITGTGFNGHVVVPLSVSRYIAVGY